MASAQLDIFEVGVANGQLNEYDNSNSVIAAITILKKEIDTLKKQLDSFRKKAFSDLGELARNDEFQSIQAQLAIEDLDKLKRALGLNDEL